MTRYVCLKRRFVVLFAPTVLTYSNMAERSDVMDLQKFGEHMWQLTTSGFTLVSVIFGDELGLFDIMQNTGNPLTSSDMAEKAGLKERYT